MTTGAYKSTNRSIHSFRKGISRSISIQLLSSNRIKLRVSQDAGLAGRIQPAGEYLHLVFCMPGKRAALIVRGESPPQCARRIKESSVRSTSGSDVMRRLSRERERASKSLFYALAIHLFFFFHFYLFIRARLLYDREKCRRTY